MKKKTEKTIATSVGPVSMQWTESNEVFNDLVEATGEALAHAKGEKEVRVTRVVNLFTKAELHLLLSALDHSNYFLLSCYNINNNNEKKIGIKKTMDKRKKLEDKINKILESMK